MRKVFKISGMTCVNCQRTVNIGLKKTKGIEEVDVSLILERAIVSFDENIISSDDIINKIKELGYDAALVEESGFLNLYFDRVDCASDSCNILKKEDLESLKGVKKTIVDNLKQTIYIEYDKDVISQEDIMAFIRSLGYEVSILEEDKTKQTLAKIIFGITSGLIIMGLSYTDIPFKSYIQMILALTVQVFVARDFYMGAISGLKAKTGNMDLLVAIGSFVSILYSIVVVFGLLKGKMYFETPTFLVSFVLIGKLIEYRLRKKASAYIKSLSLLDLRKAKILKGEKEEIVDSYSLKVGDIIILKPGDRVPVDIKIEEGKGYVDTSFINGEFEPTLAETDDVIISGSIIKEGYIKGKVINQAEKSFINELIRASNISLEKKPNIQQIADRVSSYFVQGVISLSIIVFIIWEAIGVPTYEALNFAVSSLVISCPCAVGIAVPISIMIGVSKAFKNGIIIKNAKALEILKNADTFVIDKTGTLTRGEFSVINKDIKDDIACSIVKSAEKSSNHPIAKALYEHCKEAKDIVLNCQEISGFGIKCDDYIITDASFWGVNSGLKSVGVGTKDYLMGIFYLEDILKESAFDFIKSLKQKQKDIILCSGDIKEHVENMARTLDIKKSYANMSPIDKTNLIKELQSQKHIVCMIGDGINDAKAIANADIGIAVSNALDAAKVNTDIVISNGGLEKVIYIINLADDVMKNIKQNLFWAFIYNIIMIPFASGVFSKFGLYITPEFAGLAMGFSSVSVVLNALRLNA